MLTEANFSEYIVKITNNYICLVWLYTRDLLNSRVWIHLGFGFFLLWSETRQRRENDHTNKACEAETQILLTYCSAGEYFQLQESDILLPNKSVYEESETNLALDRVP